MARQRYIQAINQVLLDEMERDRNIVLFGEDVELAIFGDTREVFNRFGPERVYNTPICETALTGMAVGAAAAGRRVILHLMFGNFIYTGMDAIAHQMAKLRMMTGGQMNLPITVIAGYGGGRSLAAQHSDTPYPVLMNIGGVNVATPATPADAKGLLTTAIRGNNPTFFLEASGRGGDSGEVPDGEYLVPFGKAAVHREGHDVTICAIGTMVRPALRAAQELEGMGVSAEVIDPRTLVPFDEAGIAASVTRTGRLVVVDEAKDRCSAASYIAGLMADTCFYALRAPIKRVTVPNVSMPYATNAEAAIFPNSAKIVAAALAITNDDHKRFA
ncbi:pyruvate dehydrogenase E1 component beta subunit [Novosphingobium capsulatum]|uniref:Pyruvate dehydrogenase E1 component beta subunit n=1 Tax=Novosphingobium capsulatum TaxID=13688 RepID=A0ABU1MRY4_9SPHN|nr:MULTISPECIES: transketolase C-terminal domain-containing protein [Novosphingobium]MBB3359749.1 pyruvate dehydrogenase E1 component beta subunit [Novosphingobium sp. BK256]MBB3376108.1 pyruvate dehydrogenase E1 component beta subunit [Novosphingobium sp. BK280]MBB3380522.1 pyruvate dehydrogenase E1 component beta subunit [Novosphingobium sp. BK258]MBB3422173.1 pyruvate dehydrogenase E1 component beta subunit [Novosphingobium sp. BK267]MBB3450971.1 pyruvate dehydrogenase E1 component beta sub